jgi:hypothetical protein
MGKVIVRQANAALSSGREMHRAIVASIIFLSSIFVPTR